MLRLSQLSLSCAYNQYAAAASSAAARLQGQRAWLSAATPRRGAPLYAVLGVQAQASQDAIKQAFRQRAKELHPDTAQGPADPEPFLRLVTAYEILSDPEQRQRYDAQMDAGLPSFVREAAAGCMSRQQQGGSSSRHNTRAGSAGGWAGDRQAGGGWWQQQLQQQEAWRYGWDEWARAGPAVMTQEDAARRRGVLGALQRYKNTLEAELHEALMVAYLGPRLDIQEGELPPAFEAEERSHPDASTDLLHLVSGRTLLGVVRENQHLHLEGAPMDGAERLSPSSMQYQPTLCATGHRQQSQQLPHGHCTAHDSAEQQRLVDMTDMSDEQLDSLLDAQHRLRGSYDWVQQEELFKLPLPEPQAQPSQEVSQSHISEGTNVIGAPDSSCVSSTSMCIGACQAHAAWLQRLEASDADNEQSVSSHSHSSISQHGEVCRTTSSSSSSSSCWTTYSTTAVSSSSASTQQAHNDSAEQLDHSRESSAAEPLAAAPGLGRSLAEGLAEGMYEAVQHLAGWQTLEHTSRIASSSAGSASHSNADGKGHGRSSSPGISSEPGTPGRSKRRAKWRRVLDPTPDWQAADWSFSDADEGVTVLEMQLNQQVAAVAVRCDTQHLRPTKVYVNDRFTVAALDDIVLVPHTGELVAAIYRMYTPGVVHTWFYRPQAPQSRLLARLKRCWLPPSGAWLFSPRDQAHNVGGWYLEHEGHQSSHKPGWLHPCVYVLTAALDSLDRERRRQSTSNTFAQLWQRSGLAGLSRWLHSSRA